MCQQLAQSSQPIPAQEDDGTRMAKRKAEEVSGDEDEVVVSKKVMRKNKT
jgi:hypothetical protein